MRTDDMYQPDRAKATVFALVGVRPVRIAGSTLEDVMTRLAALCPGGRLGKPDQHPGSGFRSGLMPGGVMKLAVIMLVLFVLRAVVKG